MTRNYFVNIVESGLLVVGSSMINETDFDKLRLAFQLVDTAVICFFPSQPIFFAHFMVYEKNRPPQ
jgi:hypothetical protein